jgi:hypothetical protein
MKRLMLFGLAAAFVLAAPGLSIAQSVELPDLDGALLALASPGAHETAGAITGTHLGNAPEPGDPAEVPGVEGVEGPEGPNDVGPNIDHQFEGEETGGQDNGVAGPGGSGQ